MSVPCKFFVVGRPALLSVTVIVVIAVLFAPPGLIPSSPKLVMLKQTQIDVPPSGFLKTTWAPPVATPDVLTLTVAVVAEVRFTVPTVTPVRCVLASAEPGRPCTSAVGVPVAKFRPERFSCVVDCVEPNDGGATEFSVGPWLTVKQPLQVTWPRSFGLRSITLYAPNAALAATVTFVSDSAVLVPVADPLVTRFVVPFVIVIDAGDSNPVPEELSVL